MALSSRVFLVAFLLVMSGICSLKANGFTDQLRAQDANSDFISWAETNQIQSPGDAWDKLQHPEWMLQLVYLWSTKGADSTGVTVRKLDESNLRLFAVDCAERVLPLFQRAYPNDRRPWLAIKTARLYANGKATKEELDTAYTNAVAASTDAYDASSATNAEAKEDIANSQADARAAEVADAASNGDTDYEALAHSESNGAFISSTEATAIFLAATAVVASAYIAFNPNATYTVPTSEPAAFYNNDPSARYIAAATEAATYAEDVYSMEDAANYARQPIDNPNAPAVATVNTADTERAWQADRLRLYFPNPFEPYIPLPPNQ